MGLVWDVAGAGAALSSSTSKENRDGRIFELFTSQHQRFPLEFLLTKLLQMLSVHDTNFCVHEI